MALLHLCFFSVTKPLVDVVEKQVYCRVGRFVACIAGVEYLHVISIALSVWKYAIYPVCLDCLKNYRCGASPSQRV